MNHKTWFFWRTLGRLAQGPLFRLRTRRLAPTPSSGPLVLLGNHAGFADPFVMALSMARPVHFMASEQLFRHPRIGPLIRGVGAFPKAKYARDKAAIAKVRLHTEAGHIVALFPEGNRSWDGRPQPVLPGLGWLLKKIDCPVVFVRNLTGWLGHPRWAQYPRYLPLRLELSEPVTFPEDWSTQQIEEECSRRIAIDPDTIELEGFTWSYKLAHGLPVYLWACPSCFAMDSLAADGDRLRCGGCGDGWTIDALTRLHPDGEGEFTTVAKAYDRIIEHFGELPTVDSDRFVDTGVALEADRLRVLRVDGTELYDEAEGAAMLSNSRLVVGEWFLPLKDLKAISIELGNKLQLRCADTLYQLETDSPLKWEHFLTAHHAASRPRRRGRRR
ncbi:MAG TPA: lysophospholipid acyltransferase family protein [Myxococcota bacterium]|nr:lysophospholipid acyltransferase family protein [Myxococcota bacterium]